MECHEGNLYILAVNYLDRCMCIITRQNDHLKYLVPLVCLRLQTSHLKSSLHIKNGYLHPRVGAETTVAEDGEKGSQFPEMAPQVRKHANIFVKTSITNPKYVIRCQSLIAGVSIYAAIMGLKMLIKPWPGFTTSMDKIFKTINR